MSHLVQGHSSFQSSYHRNHKKPWAHPWRGTQSAAPSPRGRQRPSAPWALGGLRGAGVLGVPPRPGTAPAPQPTASPRLSRGRGGKHISVTTDPHTYTDVAELVSVSLAVNKT